MADERETPTAKPADVNAGAGSFLNRMRTAQMRQFYVAISSILVAVIVLIAVSPAQISPFAYYTILLLLVTNAVLALLQSSQVLRPTGQILAKLQQLSDQLEKGEIPDVRRDHDFAQGAFSALSSALVHVLSHVLERMRHAETLQRQTEDILMAMPVALLIVSRQGKVLKTIKHQTKDLTELPEIIKVGEMPSPAVWGEENVNLYKREIERVCRTKRAAWMDITMNIPKLGQRHYHISASPYNDFSALMGVIDGTDITRNNQVRTEFAKSAAFTQKHDALRHFAASVAHDAKNLFAVLANLVEIDRNSSDPIVREQLPLIDETLQRGVSLMRELMTFSGKKRYNFTPIRADALLREAMESPSIRAFLPPNVKADVILPDGALPYVDVDREQIWKIPINLIKNLSEAFGNNPGRTTLEARTFTMTPEIAVQFRHTDTLRMGSGVLITRSDDGPGIPKKMLEHLFDPYYSSKGEGRGLGLATVLAIIMAHGGCIRVISEEGRGTMFQTWLPVSRNSPEELELMHEIAPNGEILLVDDDPAILRTTALVLRALKVAAHVAASEQVALEKLNTLGSRLKAVLVDAHLGGVPSVSFVREIRELLPNVRIILVSGMKEETLEPAFAEVSYDTFLEKPYTLAELSAALELKNETE